jgi:hypothetical protein
MSKAMGIQPDSVHYTAGRDVYGRLVRLSLAKDSVGKMAWAITREAADQRDDSATIYGLPSDVIIRLADIVQSHSR